MKNNISPRAIALTFGVLVVCFAAGFYIFAWTGPTAAPPNNNTSVPINTGTENQTKQGGLKISGTLEAAGFKIPTSAGLGKILTSDVSGAGTWQTPPLGESVLVNYGGCDEQGGVCNPASCPAGWTESGSGTWTTHAFYGPWNDFHIYRVAARTCFRTDKVCQVLVNYGGCDEQGGVCNPASCPAGWTESGSGTWTTHAFYGPWNDFHIYRVAARTCFKCF